MELTSISPALATAKLGEEDDAEQRAALPAAPPEDKSPVNQFWGLNLGGPGWIKDVLDVHVTLHTDRFVSSEVCRTLGLSRVVRRASSAGKSVDY